MTSLEVIQLKRVNPYLTVLSYAIPKRRRYSLFPTYQEELHHQSRTVFSTNHATDRKRRWAML